MTSRVLSTSPSETQKPGLEYSQRANLPRIQAHPCDSGLSQTEHCKFPASGNLSFFFSFFLFFYQALNCVNFHGYMHKCGLSDQTPEITIIRSGEMVLEHGFKYSALRYSSSYRDGGYGDGSCGHSIPDTMGIIPRNTALHHRPCEIALLRQEKKKKSC